MFRSEHCLAWLWIPSRNSKGSSEVSDLGWPPHTPYHIFGTCFYGFLGDGFEYVHYIEWTSLTLIIDTLTPWNWPAHVMTPKCDVTDLTYDVIMVTVSNFSALYAVNIRCRCTKNTKSEAKLHEEHVGEGFMSLCLLVFLQSARKVEKVPISRKNDLWPATSRSNIELGSKVG